MTMSSPRQIRLAVEGSALRDEAADAGYEAVAA
jgi:hypothetical protein